MKKIKVYAIAETKQEVLETLSNLISCLDYKEVVEINNICVFDIKKENEHRGFSIITMKRGNE